MTICGNKIFENLEEDLKADDSDLGKVAAEVHADKMRQDKEIQDFRSKLGKREWGKLFIESMVDAKSVARKTLGGLGDLGKRARIRMDAIANAPTNAKRILDEAYENIYAGLNKHEHKLLDFIIESRRTMALYDFGSDARRPIDGVRERIYLQKLRENVEALGGAEAWDDLWGRTEIYSKVYREQLNRMNEAGLIDDVQFENMDRVGFYSPSLFMQYIDPEVSGSVFKKTSASVRDSGLKNLDTGDIKALEKDSHLLMVDYIARTENRIARNKANQAILDIAQQAPSNGVFRVLGKGKAAHKGEAEIAVMAKQKAVSHVKTHLILHPTLPKEGSKQDMIGEMYVNAENTEGETSAWTVRYKKRGSDEVSSESFTKEQAAKDFAFLQKEKKGASDVSVTRQSVRYTIRYRDIHGDSGVQTKVFKKRSEARAFAKELTKRRPSIRFRQKSKVGIQRRFFDSNEEAQAFIDQTKNNDDVEIVHLAEQMRIAMPREVAESLSPEPMANEMLTQSIGLLSGASFLRASATGLNPLFAIANFPRDIAHIFFVTREYSSFLPLAGLQVARDLAVTFADAVSVFNFGIFKPAINKLGFGGDNVGPTGRLAEFLDEGGGRELLTEQGRITFTNNKFVEKLFDYGGAVGRFSELWVRLALRNRAIDNIMSQSHAGQDISDLSAEERFLVQEEATSIAANYIDFNQGGKLAKFLNHVIPYFNASIQATRGMAREAKRSPAVFITKASQVLMLGFLSFMMNRSGEDDEPYDHIPDHEKSRYWNFMLWNWFADDDGTKRTAYVRVAKDQGQSVFAAMGEILAAQYISHTTGKPVHVNMEQFWDSLDAFTNIMPDTFIPPSVDALLGYFSNWDTFRERKIWEDSFGRQVKPSEEYNPWTHPAFVQAGQLTGTSPERLRYVWEQFFTGSNWFIQLGGASLRHMFEAAGAGTKGQEDETGPEFFGKPLQEVAKKMMPGIDKVVRVTHDTNYAAKKQATEIQTQVNTERSIVERGFTEVLQEFDRSGDRKPVIAYIKGQEKEDRAWLQRKFRQAIKLQRIAGIGDKPMWIHLSTLSPKARARAFHAMTLGKPEKERVVLERTARKVPGLWSDTFVKNLRIVRDKAKQEGFLQ